MISKILLPMIAVAILLGAYYEIARDIYTRDTCQSSLDAEYESSGGYEIQCDELNESLN